MVKNMFVRSRMVVLVPLIGVLLASMCILNRQKKVPNSEINMKKALEPEKEQDVGFSNLAQVRKAAMEFCLKFGFPKEKQEELKGPPLEGPINLKRNGKQMKVFRWLGHGRGDYIVQCEIDIDTGQITVYGGFGHKEFGPWKPEFK